MEDWYFKLVTEAFNLFWNAAPSDGELLLEKYLTVHPIFATSYAEAAVVAAMLTEEKEAYKTASARLNTALDFTDRYYRKFRPALKNYVKIQSVNLGQDSTTFLAGRQAEGGSERGDPSTEVASAPSNKAEFQKQVADALLCKVLIAETNFWTSLLKFKKEQYMKGVIYFRKGWKFYEESEAYRRSIPATEYQNLPHFEIFSSVLDFGLAIYHFAISAVPRHLLWLVEGIGFKGDREVAMLEFKRCSEVSASHRATHASAALAWIHAFFFNNFVDAESTIDSLIEKYSTGALLYYSRGYILRKQGKLVDSTKSFEKAFEFSSEIVQFQLKAEYEIGYNFTLQLMWEPASVRLENHLQKCNSRSFRVYAAFQLAVCYLMLNQQPAATEWMKKIGGWVRKNEAYDEYANRIAKMYLDNKGFRKFELLSIQCMFLHEGCSFEKCLELLEQARTAMEFKDDKAVYLYLKGSCLQELNNLDEAEKCYNEVLTLEKGVKTEIYVFPRSYCRLAEIHIKKANNFDTIEAYIKKAKSYTNYDFEAFLAWKIRKCQEDLEKLKKQK